VLHALPDRRGRVVVSVGGARGTLPAERVGGGEPRAPVPRAPLPPERPPDAEAGHCDLRGLRVAEALDELVASLDRACAASKSRLLVVHGLGTGALRKAVRETLQSSPYVVRVESAPPHEGGDGATVAVLA
jgi:DNA mismatch repair protein MutS2